MNRELMEKIAKRKEDPNYPYGNKLGVGYAAKSALSDAAGGALIGGALISPVSCWLGSKAGKAIGGLAPGGKDVGEGIGALTGATLPIVWGAIDMAKSGKDKRLNNRALSYLPSEEQKALKKKEDNIDKKRMILRRAQESLYAGDIDSISQKALDALNESNAKYEEQIDDLDDRYIKLRDSAYARGKALMLAEKKNRRLLKTASDYLDEAVMEKEAKQRFAKWIEDNPKNAIEYLQSRNDKGVGAQLQEALTNEGAAYNKYRQKPAINHKVNLFTQSKVRGLTENDALAILENPAKKSLMGIKDIAYRKARIFRDSSGPFSDKVRGYLNINKDGYIAKQHEREFKLEKQNKRIRPTYPFVRRNSNN